MYQFDDQGNRINVFSSAAIDHYFAQVKEKRDYFQTIISMTQVLLVVLVVGGLVIAAWVASKHEGKTLMFTIEEVICRITCTQTYCFINHRFLSLRSI